MDRVKVFAPASVGNIGPGFDVLGMAVDGLGDTVEARRIDGKKVRIEEITGDQGDLPREASRNTAGIAASAVLKLLKAPGGVAFSLHKGIPGTGLGSSAASAVAAALATYHLYETELSKSDLILPCAAAESRISGGVFLDNIGASLLGGVVITHPVAKTVYRVGAIAEVVLIIVTPTRKVLTRKARKILPSKVDLRAVVANLSQACALVAAVAAQDARMFGAAVQDSLIEPVRARLIPGFAQVKKAALKNGALGCSISGAGASVFSVADNREQAARIGQAMQRAFSRQGVESVLTVTGMDAVGARVIAS